MLSKFFHSLKPKEYSVQVLRDNTSQGAVKRIKRNRTSAPLKKLATLTLVLSFVGGGLVSATAATAMTAKQANANVVADMVCIKADADNSGAWNGGANVYGTIGGRAQYSMDKIGRNTPVSDAAYDGKAGSWGGNSAPAGEQGKYLTAYEKYGVLYPQYDSWVPVFADKKVSVKQIDSSKGSYSTGEGKLPVKGGNDLEAGASPLTTTDVGSCLAFMPAVSAGISNLISVLPRFVMGASLELYATAYGSSISDKDSVLYGIGQSINKFITQPGGLKDSLFIPFILPLLLIGAIWVGYVGIVKRAAMQAVQSTAWMIVAIALGTIFLAQPTLVSSFVDSTVAQVQRIVNESVLSGSSSNNMCNLDGSGDSRATIRETKCTIWHSTIYTTWVAGQFGQGANSSTANGSILTQEADRDVLGNNTYSIHYGSSNVKPAETWPQFMIDRQVTNKSLELSEVAWAQLSGAGGATINADWAGSMGMISSSVLMFFGAGASSAVLLVYGFTLLIYQLMMISAVLMSPFFFLFGIVPNWGRRVLMRYAELLTSLAVKRIVTGTMLAFYLLFYNLIIGDANLGLLLVKLIIIFALAVFFIGSRKKFVNMFADNINFGGNKSVGLPGNKAIALAAGLGVGAIGGGLIGGAIVAHKTRKSNKDMEGKISDIKLEGGNPTADIKTPPRGPNSGGGGGNGDKSANPVATVSKVVGTIETAKGAKQLVDEMGQRRAAVNNAPQAAQTGQNVPAGTAPANASATASGGASGTTQAGSAAATPSSAAGSAGKAATSGVGGVGRTVMPQAAQAAGTKLAGGATSTAAGGATAGGAGATVAPTVASGAAGITGGGAAAGAASAGTAGASAAGVSAAGAAAAGTSGAAAGAASGVAAGGAAAGIAGGAAAGSVVPVVGTVAGAAVGAAAAAVAAKKKREGEKGDQG